MALRKMWDAAYPMKVVEYGIPNWSCAALYIGGNTPHVATDAEWDRVSGPGRAARYRLPIFTRSHDGDPVADAKFSVGWLKGHGVPAGSTLALDYEARVDGVYLRAFDKIVVAAGYKTMVYGQLSTILDNPKPSGGYWIAHWTGTAHMEPGAAATQWSGSGPFGGAYDPNLVADSTPLWDTQGADMALTDTDKQYIVDTAKAAANAAAKTVVDAVVLNYRYTRSGVNEASPEHPSIKDVLTKLDTLTATLQAQGIVVDPGAIARAVVDDYVNRVSFKAA